MLRNRFFIAAQARERPVASRMGVGHSLESSEGLRSDDEEGFRRVKITNRLCEVGAIDVGNESEGHPALAVMSERLIGHNRAEVGTADPDLDHASNAPARVALPS